MKRLIFPIVIFFQSLFGFSQQDIYLTQKEKEALIYMREEEKLARDIYDSMYFKWSGNPFGNIRQSEQIHMDRMKFLITTYKLYDPVEKNNDKHGIFINVGLQQNYKELVSAGSRSLTEALKAGAKIEEMDIADLEERIKQTERQDITNTYNYLMMASGNHLRAFVHRLKMLGINYDPVILNKASFDKIITE